jgi:pyruvate-ferredoxin/flavodoxin oxidoreductase
MASWTELTGRRRGMIDAYRCEDATEIVVSMGTIADTASTVVDHLREGGRRVGSVAVTAFRPFPAAELARVLQAARTIGVIERTDDPAAGLGPLAREVKAALFDLASDAWPVPHVLSAAAGLGSRDIAAGDLVATFDWLADPAAHDRKFVVLGLHHRLALERADVDLVPRGAFRVRGHSVGGFGSVTTNKLLASLVGETFGRHVQAYPRYGSEKKGLPTAYFLTIADEPIRSHNELEQVDFVPLHDVAAFRQGNPLRGLVDGGALFVQTTLEDPEAIWAAIPAPARTEILERGIHVTALDTAALARAHAPRPDLAVRMQGVALVGVFLRIAPFAAEAGLDREHLLEAVRRQLGRFFGKRGGAVVDANLEVVAAAYDGLIDVTGRVTGLTAAARRELVAAGTDGG